MRHILKQVAFAFGVLLVLPAWLSFVVKRALVGPDRAVMSSTQTLSLIPGLLGQVMRRAFLWLVLDACATTVTVEFGTTFSKVAARLGENVYIGPGCSLGDVVLERNVLLAPSVHIPSGPDTHGTARLDLPIRDQPGSLRTVRIGEGTWIGTGAIVLDDVGPHAVVAAGAVVTAPVAAYLIVGGVPARVLKDRRGGTP